MRLIREGIETRYQLQLEEALQKIEVEQGKLDKKALYSHPTFVAPMLNYIITDFENSRIQYTDNSIGGMVICDSSEQVKMMYELFIDHSTKNENDVAETAATYEATSQHRLKQHRESNVKSAALILHDIGTKEERKEKVEDFKTGKIDLLFVYNMLLTGFDAKRLKKLYIGRVIKAHNLLQALTRVNRTYKAFKYGYVVDFADISSEFTHTNQDYFDELQSELGDEIETYSNLFKTEEEIDQEIL